MSAVTNWFQDLSNLLNSSLPKDDEKSFSSSIQNIVDYVELKHSGRCLSKKIFIKEEQQRLIHKLFESYQRGITPSELIHSKIMRKLVKRNRDNENNLDFLGENYTQKMAKLIFDECALKRDPAILYWLREFSATIHDPATIETQKKLLVKLPEEYDHLLFYGRGKLGKELAEEVAKGNIGASGIDEIIEYIRGNIKLSSPIDLTDPLRYFGMQYRLLIQGGDHYEEQFRESLISELENYKKDPTVTKKPFPKQ